MYLEPGQFIVIIMIIAVGVDWAGSCWCCGHGRGISGGIWEDWGLGFKSIEF